MLLDFNQVLPVAGTANKISSSSDATMLPTVKVRARISKPGYWAGMPAQDLKSIYRQLYGLGTLSKAHYIVELEPYDSTGPLSEILLFDKVPLRTDSYNLTGVLLPWLATECSLSVLDAQSDSVQAGHYQQNFITGNNSSEVQVTFLETKGAAILNAAQEIKAVMFASDGTQGLPAEYMMRLKISLFPRDDRSGEVFSEEWLVALQAASVDLAAQNKDALEVPLTFLKMYPML